MTLKLRFQKQKEKENAELIILLQRNISHGSHWLDWCTIQHIFLFIQVKISHAIGDSLTTVRIFVYSGFTGLKFRS